MKKSSKKSFAIGMDLGGSKIEAGMVDLNGRIISSIRAQTPIDKGSVGIIEALIICLEKIEEKTGRKAEAVGIGAAGQIDSKGVLIEAPNLPLKNMPLKKKLENELKIPVVVTNDVRAAAFGEWRYGSGKGIDDIVVLFVGTGIGGGVVSGGRLLSGCTNTFGELGHITLVADGRRCRCLNLGCLEAYAGGWAIAERARQAVLEDQNKGRALLSLAGSIENITAETVGRAYKNGDPLSKEIVYETSEFLSAGAVGIVNAFNPCALILGGGVIEGISDLITSVEKNIRTRALWPGALNLRVKKAKLAGQAGVIGAAAIAYKEIGEAK